GEGEGHDESITDRRAHCDELIDEQIEAPAVEETVEPESVDAVGGEEAEQQRPDDAAHEMNGDDIQRVVEAEAELQLNGEEAQEAGDEDDGDAGDTADETGARRDGDQAGDRPGRGPEGGGLAVL